MPRIDEPKYEAMIAALARFASQIDTTTSEIESQAASCIQNLGEEDKAVPEIQKKIRDSQLKYLKAARQALTIAKELRDELEEQRKEDQIWDNDDSE